MKQQTALQSRLILIGLVLIFAALACAALTGQPQAPSLPAAQPSTTEEGAAAPADQALPVIPSLTLADEVVLTGLYERVNPGVVLIRVLTNSGAGQGSGFVVDKEGHILTNYHVVESATNLEVAFPSGVKVFGKVIGTDLDSDLAVIKVDVPADELVPLPLGDSDQLKVGQFVVAIGNPFGLSGTMTVGIISAKGRVLESLNISGAGTYYSAGDLIQTDAAINPGNSGGPLLNLQGEVVGVNRAIRTTGLTEPSNTGIGFAVSSNIVRRVLPALIATGSFQYPYLGISTRSELTLFEAQELKLPQASGALVIEVVAGGPCDKAGVKSGDLITGIDGQPVQVFGDLLAYLFKFKSPGDEVTLHIFRGGRQIDLTVTLGSRSK